MRAVLDLEELRKFADASQKEYDALREDIAIGVGAKEYSYETHAKAMYAAADAPTKHAIDAWILIENNVPAEATKETKALADYMQEYQKAQEN